MPSEGWWEAERWGKKDLVAQHAKKTMSSSQSALLPREDMFSSPVPLWPIITVKSQARCWEKTRDAVDSHLQEKQKIGKDENEKLDHARGTKKHQDNPSPLPRANLIIGRATSCERHASLPGSLLNIRELLGTPQIYTATTVASTQMQTPSHRHFLHSI